MLLQETKLHQGIKSTELAIPGYALFRRDRTANGGGVAVYAKEDLKPKAHVTISTDFLELVSVKLRLVKNPVTIASVYRPPSQNREKLEDFHEHLADYLSTLDLAASPLLLAGDMNLCWASAESTRLKALADDLELVQAVREATHQKRTIDLLLKPRRTQLRQLELLVQSKLHTRLSTPHSTLPRRNQSRQKWRSPTTNERIGRKSTKP